MYERKVFISDELIQEKARRIQILLNEQISRGKSTAFKIQ